MDGTKFALSSDPVFEYVQVLDSNCSTNALAENEAVSVTIENSHRILRTDDVPASLASELSVRLEMLR